MMVHLKLPFHHGTFSVGDGDNRKHNKSVEEMSFLHLNTFLRSSIAKDPFCLGEIGPEDVLRIEAEFPILFGEVENRISDIKEEEIKPKKSVPPKHDCLKKINPPRSFVSRKVDNTQHKPVNKSPQVRTFSGRKLHQNLSEVETRKNTVSSQDKEDSLSLMELRSSLLDILSRCEHDFPTEVRRNPIPRENRVNSIDKTLKHKPKVQLLHIKKVEKKTRKNPPANVPVPSKSLPNVIPGKRKVSDINISKRNSSETCSRKTDTASSRKNVPFARNVVITKANATDASHTTTQKPAPGFLRNAAFFNAPKAINKAGSRASQSKQSNIGVNETVNVNTNRTSIPVRKTESKKRQDSDKDFSPIKTQPSENLSETDSLSASLLENNPLKTKETYIPEEQETAVTTDHFPGQIHIRKPAGNVQDEIKIHENIPKPSVSRFEQLLLARTLASQYERQGRLHKHQPFSAPKKSHKDEPELPAPMRKELPLNFSRDFHVSTPSCRKTLEKIAGELIYAEVLKYLDTERYRIESTTEKATAEENSTKQTENGELKLSEEEEKSKSVISAESGRSDTALSTINEESEFELVTPELTPPVSLLQTTPSKEYETEQSSFLSPVTSTALETPELTPIAKYSSPSKSSTQGKLSKVKGNIPGPPANNETTDCSELSDFIFTEGKLDTDISKSKTLEELLFTPVLSDYIAHHSESIAEKELPNDSQSHTSAEIEISTPKSSVRAESLQDSKTCESSPSQKQCEMSEESDNTNKANVTFKKPPATEFGLPSKKSTVTLSQTKGRSLTSSKFTKKSKSTFGSILVSETEGTGASVTATASFTALTGTTMSENLSEGEIVGKRYKSPGELSGSFYPSPGLCPFSYPGHLYSSEDSENGDAVSEGTELSFGEIVAGRSYKL